MESDITIKAWLIEAEGLINKASEELRSQGESECEEALDEAASLVRGVSIGLLQRIMSKKQSPRDEIEAIA